MDLKIDFKNFDRDALDMEMPTTPAKVFVDFLAVEGITQEEFQKLIDIYNKFPDSSLFFVNLSNTLQDELKFLLNRDEKIMVIRKQPRKATNK